MGSAIGVPFGGGLNFSSHTIGGQTPDFWITPDSRAGNVLQESINEDNVTILKPGILVDASLGFSNLCLDTDIIPDSNTIMVLRCSYYPVAHSYREGSQSRFFIGTYDYGGIRYIFQWGDGYGLSHTNRYGTTNLIVDGNVHTLLAYNKKLWLLDADCDLDDDSILNYISQRTPLINITSATWVDETTNIRLCINYSQTFLCQGEKYLAWIGNLVDNNITWQRKYVYNNVFGAFDLVNDTFNYFLNNTENYFKRTLRLKKIYSIYGYDLLSTGYSKSYNDAYGHLDIPPKSNGSYNENTCQYFVKYDDVAGDDLNHNMADTILRFPLNSIWNRSNTDVWKQLARNRKWAHIYITGSSGSADITINGTTKTMTWDTNIYDTVTDFIANNMNYFDCILQYSDYYLRIYSPSAVNSIENVSIVNKSGTLTGVVTYFEGYDENNPSDWHISELNALLLNEWLNDDYKYRIFIKALPDSVDLENKTKLLEIFTYPNNLTEAQYKRVLRYTGDYSKIYF